MPTMFGEALLTPHPYVTDDPYPKILLSRAMGYVDTMLPGEPYTTTAQEQFNAYVVRNPANRYMKDGGREPTLHLRHFHSSGQPVLRVLSLQ